MSNIVELCSAADSVEASAIAGALEAAGIKAEVVGEMLQAAAGGLPLGETTAPRIWVPEELQERAQGILAEYRAAVSRDAQQPPADEDAAADIESTETEPSEEQPEAEPGHDVSLLSVLLTLAGMTSIIFGAYYGFANHQLLARYSAHATATPVSASTAEKEQYDVDLSRFTRSLETMTTYRYTANGHPHTFVADETGYARPKPIDIRYDPNHPEDYRLGEISRPAWSVLFGVLLGGFLIFLAYQFR